MNNTQDNQEGIEDKELQSRDSDSAAAASAKDFEQFFNDQPHDDDKQSGFSLRRFFAGFKHKDDEDVDHEATPVVDTDEPAVDDNEAAPVEEPSVGEQVEQIRATKAEKEALLKALDSWKKQLSITLEEDVTCHVVELSAAHPTGLAQLYAGRPTKLSNLVREERALGHCRSRARELIAATRQMEERHGVGPTYLAIGTVSWVETRDPEGNIVLPDTDHSGDVADNESVHEDLETLMSARPQVRKFSGPALLAPVVVDATDDDIIVTLERSVRLWPELERALVERGLSDKLPDILDTCHTPRGFSPIAPLSPLTDIAKDVLAGFDLYESLTVGQYIHPGHVLIDDLARVRALVESDDLSADNPQAYALLCALSGEESAQHSPLIQRPLPRPVEYDRDPEKEHGVGDLDPDQHNALDAVASGAHLVLNAPPGSERLTTVVAMLVDCALEGKTVAYVPGEKARAQEVLVRLEELGLSDMAIDLSSLRSWRDKAPMKLRDALDKAAPMGSSSRQSVHTMREQLVKVRQYLGGYFYNLHKPSEEWGVSAFDALQVLTDLTSTTPGPRTRVRLDREVVTELANDGAEYARSLLMKAERVGLFTDTGTVQPWLDLHITDPDDVDGLVNNIRDISIQILPQVRAHISRTAKETGLVEATTVDQWLDQLEMLQDVRTTLDKFLPEVFEQSAADMVIATAVPQWRKERSLHMRASTRRRLIKQAKDMVRPGVHIDDLHAELVRIQEQRQIWRDYSEAGGYPVLPVGMDQMVIIVRQLTDALLRVKDFFPPERGDLLTMPLTELVRTMDMLAQDEQGALELPSRVAVLSELHDMGLMDLVNDLRKRHVSEDMISAELDLSWWASALAHILAADPLLSRFDGEQIRQLSAQLRVLDKEQVDSLAPQAALAFSALQRRVIEADSQGASYLLHEVGGTQHASMSTLYRQCPMATHLIPIRIVPPVIVPQICPGDQHIDVVVLDGIEAVSVAELIPTLSRATQVVIIGDRRREREGAVKEFASFLPHMTIPPTRSRIHEQVAKFMAEHGYGDNVMAVPAPRATSTMTLTIVDGRGAQAPGMTAIESSVEEVDRVVAMVIEVAQQHPDESLAVVALNPRHAARINEEIIAARAKHPDLDDFFSQMKTEPFSVVSAGECAGLRRDRVIIAVGYAKTPHGRIIHDFGQISTPEGPSIIVDALGTVRKDLMIVSAFDPQEVDRQRLGDDSGAHMLIDLLQAAQADDDIIRVQDNRQSESENEPDRLLVDLAERLFDKGLVVVPNVGSPVGMTIPLAIGHPDIPHEMLLAVLTDNRDYVAEKSLRRRERHWRKRLEDYGWNVHTVYSMSVFADPQGEADRIVTKILDIIDERNGVTRPKVHEDDHREPSGEDNYAPAPPTVEEEIAQGAPSPAPAQVEEPAREGTPTHEEPPAQPATYVEPPVQPVAHVEPPVQPVAYEEPPAKPAPPASPQIPTHRIVEPPAKDLFAELAQSTPPVHDDYEEPMVEISHISDDFANIVGTPTGATLSDDEVDYPRPSIAQGLPLAAYTDDQLDELLAWLMHTYKTTNHDVLVEHLKSELRLPENTEQTDLVVNRSVERFLASYYG